MEDIIICLKEYCAKELSDAKYDAEQEHRYTSEKSLNELLPSHLSKLYYRAILAIEQYNK